MKNHHVLLISCSDEKGLVYKVMGVLFKRQLNVIENTETVDRVTDSFFMRTEFMGEVKVPDLLAELKPLLPKTAQVQIRSRAAKRLLLLATKESHCLGDLLLRADAGELNAEILAVISNYENLGDLVRRFDVPYHFVSVTGDDRTVHEAALQKLIAPYKADYLVLAKYMRVLSANFVAQYPKRILNIHHSFLPAFIGSNPYKQAYERGVKIIGATAHFVTEELDDGPIITQSVIPVNHSLGPQEMARAGRDVERLVLAKALQLVLEDRVLVQGRRSIVFE